MDYYNYNFDDNEEEISNQEPHTNHHEIKVSQTVIESNKYKYHHKLDQKHGAALGGADVTTYNDVYKYLQNIMQKVIKREEEVQISAQKHFARLKDKIEKIAEKFESTPDNEVGNLFSIRLDLDHINFEKEFSILKVYSADSSVMLEESEYAQLKELDTQFKESTIQLGELEMNLNKIFINNLLGRENSDYDEKYEDDDDPPVALEMNKAYVGGHKHENNAKEKVAQCLKILGDHSTWVKCIIIDDKNEIVSGDYGGSNIACVVRAFLNFHDILKSFNFFYFRTYVA